MKKDMLSGKKIGAAVLMLTVILVFSCTTAGKSVDSEAAARLMVRFDRAYIPSLAMTSKGDPKGSEKAITILIEEWTVLRPEFSSLFSGDRAAEKNISTVNDLIITAANDFAGGVELSEIHETLEKIKKPFRDIRSKNHIEYYPDLLEGYHVVMEDILAITSGKSPSDLSSHDIAEIHKLAAEGLAQWRKIDNAYFDSSLFGFSASKTEAMKMNIKKGIEEGEKFLSIVESGDSSRILAEAAVIKPYYTKVFLMFGDFARLK